MPHIFISYAKKDTKDLAFALADVLNALDGYSAWVDRSMRAGRAWEIQIETEIDKCDYIVVLYSEDLHRHKHGEEPSYILTELDYAKRDAKKPIIPVMAQKTSPPMSMRMEHYIDFIGLGMTVESLVDAICEEVNLGLSPNIASVPHKSSLDLLPKPFKWVIIPQGEVTLTHIDGYLKAPTSFVVPTFQMSKYPITNAQFRLFIEDGGYNNKNWWTNDGWLVRSNENWIQPQSWDINEWNESHQPVVGVSWYEAIAYCLWLSSTTQEKIILPSEHQWQWAAQGIDGREYPWGNGFDRNKCNTDKSGISKTTSVLQYEDIGNSPFGVVDMAGNVWHWCLTNWETGQNELDGMHYRCVRGGSWFDRQSYARTDFRLGLNASVRNLNIGFFIGRFI